MGFYVADRSERMAAPRGMRAHTVIHIFNGFFWRFSVAVTNDERSICPNRGDELIGEFLRYYRQVTPKMSLDYENAVQTLKTSGDFTPYFRSARSKLHGILTRHLGPVAASFRIHSYGNSPFTCYELAVPADAIVLPDELS